MRLPPCPLAVLLLLTALGCSWNDSAGPPLAAGLRFERTVGPPACTPTQFGNDLLNAQYRFVEDGEGRAVGLDVHAWWGGEMFVGCGPIDLLVLPPGRSCPTRSDLIPLEDWIPGAGCYHDAFGLPLPEPGSRLAVIVGSPGAEAAPPPCGQDGCLELDPQVVGLSEWVLLAAD